jgi:glucose-1-phosphate cytidylyltransferase
MKVVLFCGGLGMRLREYSEYIPKPMVNIGHRPILWHLMKYYAHYGHNDFILCLGYKADIIKNYFLNYDECVSNNFILSKGGKDLELLNKDIDDWKITFVDTGISSNIGQRLKIVEEYLEGEDIFLANYADGLTDLPLPEYINHFINRNKVASFICIKPHQSFHIVSISGDIASKIKPMNQYGIWVNGGFFLFKKDIFNYIKEGEELVNEPFQRLIEEEQLIAYKYKGFWGCMDTFKDKQLLDDMFTRGETPWQVWNSTNKKINQLPRPSENLRKSSRRGYR